MKLTSLTEQATWTRYRQISAFVKAVIWDPIQALERIAVSHYREQGKRMQRA